MTYDTLVLSGESVKGILTLGALQCAYDNFLIQNITTYVGTSSGSLISYLVAIGYTPIEIMVHICINQTMDRFSHFNLVAMIQGNGASSFTYIQEQLEKMTISKLGYLPTLNDVKVNLGKTLVFATYNMTKEKTEYLSVDNYPTLPCITALRMSCNLPLIFENFTYGGSMYVDGGVSDNFAIDIGDMLGTKVLGIQLENEDMLDVDNNVIEYVYKLMSIPMSLWIKTKCQNASEKCKIVNIKYKNLPFFNLNISSSDKLSLFSTGYQQMTINL
jgi:predicted acylesterase/phospholipase RssA